MSEPLETSDVRWEYEDELPEMGDADFDAIFKASRVDGVRLYPFVEDSKGNRIWITHLPNAKCAGTDAGSASPIHSQPQ